MRERSRDGLPLNVDGHRFTGAVEHELEVARRRGVGMFILDKADQIARAGGRSSIRADVYELNGPMQNLLEKHGYERCGTITIKDVFGRVKHRVGYERMLR